VWWGGGLGEGEGGLGGWRWGGQMGGGFEVVMGMRDVDVDVDADVDVVVVVDLMSLISGDSIDSFGKSILICDLLKRYLAISPLQKNTAKNTTLNHCPFHSIIHSSGRMWR